MRKYHWFLLRIDGQWTIEFGDYDKECVRTEMSLYRARRDDKKLITAPSDDDAWIKEFMRTI